MASIDEVTKILKKGIRFGAVGRVHPKQIDEAAERISKIRDVNWDVIQQIGQDVAGDRLLFNDVDIDELQKMVERNRPEVYAKSEDDI